MIFTPSLDSSLVGLFQLVKHRLNVEMRRLALQFCCGDAMHKQLSLIYACVFVCVCGWDVCVPHHSTTHPSSVTSDISGSSLVALASFLLSRYFTFLQTD